MRRCRHSARFPPARATGKLGSLAQGNRHGHKYLTLVYQIEEGCKRLLYVGLERTADSLRGFFESVGATIAAGLQYVCSDMWQPYLDVLAEQAPQAVHVLDRYHLVARLNKALDEVRAEEARRLKADGYEPVLKHSRWCLLKRPENLTDQQTVKMQELLRYNLRSVRAYLHKEDLQRLWVQIQARSPACEITRFLQHGRFENRRRFSWPISPGSSCLPRNLPKPCREPRTS